MFDNFEDWRENINKKIGGRMLPTEEMISPLLELGLNKYEAKVYVTLVAEGISTAKNLSDITGIPYGKVYEIIDSLSSKGFSMVLPTKPMKCQAVNPKEAILSTKKRLQEKMEKLEVHVAKELEPMFAESKKFTEPKSVFWVINGRSNVVKKIDELIKKAKKHIYVCTTSNGLSRMLLHKELLKEASDKNIKIMIAAVTNKDVLKEIGSLNFCKIKHIAKTNNHLFSIDGKECLLIEPIPDDDNIVYGRDLGIWILSDSFTKFIEDFFVSHFNKSREVKL